MSRHHRNHASVLSCASKRCNCLTAPKPGVRATLVVVIAVVLGACGERISTDDVDRISMALADALVAVQSGSDSLSRARIADSVAEARGFSNWSGLREAINDATVEPERLRAVLDSTQKRIERRTLNAITPNGAPAAQTDSLGMSDSSSMQPSDLADSDHAPQKPRK